MAEKNKQKTPSVLKGSCLWGILLFAILVLIDQLTKAAAEILLAGGKEYPLVGNLIGLRLTFNTGIAYGIGGDASPKLKIGVIVGTGVIMLALTIAYFLLDKRRSWLRTAFVFIVAGGVGNLIDRVYYKVWSSTTMGVRDMVDLSKFGFAVCNFADFFISAGAVMLVLAFLFFDTDAIFPQGKYKQLQKEAEEKSEEKESEKGEKKVNG